MFKFCILFCAIAITLSSCADENPLQEFSRGNEKFTADLVQLLVKENLAPDKAAISPLSAEIILALTAEGANGETGEELRRALSLPNKERTASAVKSLIPLLEKSSDNFTLSLANKLYINLKFQILKSYQDVAKSDYHSDVEKVNFAENQKTANLINKWVESKTNNKIKDLIKTTDISAATALVLVNTLYLKGKFVTPFAGHKTSKKPFYSESGKVTNVDTMQSADNAQYLYFHCGFLKTKFLEIPYVDSSVSITFVLPDARDGLTSLERDVELYLKPHNLTPQRVAVSLPKFSVTDEYDFKKILNKLGVSKVFDANEADLSGISGKRDLFVSFVKQKVFLNITETGTEAAAATAGGLSPTSIRDPPSLTFNADHPFVYFIRESKSNVILFIGRYK